MARCWHCEVNEEDPALARKVKLYADIAEATVEVPTCTTCAAAVHRIDVWAVPLVLVGIVALIAAPVILILGNVAAAAAALAIVVLSMMLFYFVHRPLARVRHDTVEFPGIVQLLEKGWRVDTDELPEIVGKIPADASEGQSRGHDMLIVQGTFADFERAAEKHRRRL